MYGENLQRTELLYLLSLLESEGGDGGAGISAGGDGAAVNAGILGGSSGGAGSGGTSGGVDALGGAGGIRSIAGAVDVESHGGAGATGAAGRNNLGLSGSTDAATSCLQVTNYWPIRISQVSYLIYNSV